MSYVPEEDQAAVVEEMARVLVRGFSPLMLMLFGSRARGDHDEYSDVDFVAVVDAPDVARVEDDMRRAVARFGMDVHIMARGPREFLAESRVPGALMYPAAREGRVLHEWPGWRERFPVAETPERTLSAVLEREYRARVRDYLRAARSHLSLGSWMRCRDNCRYAAVVAMKGLACARGAHPPRDVDVAFQFRAARALHPELDELSADADALHRAEPADAAATQAVLDTARRIVRRALALYPGD